MSAVKSVSKQTLIDYDDTLFMLVETTEKFDIGQVYYIDAIVVNSMDPKVYAKVFHEIRRHYDPDVYLKPIFAVAYKSLSDLLMHSCDGITDLAQYQQIAQRVKQIKANNEQVFLQQEFYNAEEGYIFKLLQFMYSRGTPLMPFPDRFSRTNYYFPFLSDLLDDVDDGKAMEIIFHAKKKGFLIDDQMIDKVHLCDSCGSAHHNLRETCKSCGSIDLEIKDLIHHFRCAYIGPETDFMQEHSDDFVCPKCQKILRHIGNDYDKPSHIYVCNTCDHPFQDPRFTYSCVDCRTTNDIQHLQEFKIRKMLLSTKGKYLVLNGLPKKVETKLGLDSDVIGIYDVGIFQNLLKQEQARIRANGGNSVLGEVRVTDPELNLLSRREIQILQGELSIALKSYLSEFDTVTSINAFSYYFLLSGTTDEIVEELKGVISFNMKYLITSNIVNSKVEVEVEVKKVEELEEEFNF
ncbi:MAG: ribosomal protein S27AE [Patescibacteria group bacterium]|jgi:ribosomal protein S27AE